MKKLYFLLTVILLLPFTLSAQNEDDALRYSFLTFGGTARSLGLAGAFGAVGADFSTLSTNPAGIGLYKSSEFTFTPSLFAGKSSTNFGKTYEDQRYNFNFSNVGMVLAFPANTELTRSGWKYFQFGFGINRNQDYNNRMVINGENHQSSLLDQWVKLANGKAWDELDAFDVDLGYWTYLINPDSAAGENQWSTAVPAGGLLQRKDIDARGSMNEWVFTLGANYDDRLYFGATLGFPFLNYHEESTYQEEALADVIGTDQFRNFSYHQNLDVDGSGVNFKFGMIFKPVDFIRIGAAVHTPSYFYNLHENYSSSVNSEFDDGKTYTKDSPEGKYDYKLNTPMRAMGNIAFIFGQYGLISVDYEFVDYSESRFRSSDAEVYFDVNDAIRNKYTTASNLRVGGEYRIDQFTLRGGYALYGNPFKSGINDSERTSYSGGIGMRQDNYFLDFAYVYTGWKQDYYMYSSKLVGPSKNEYSAHNFLMTLGFKF